jgi:hypothetical protein
MDKAALTQYFPVMISYLDQLQTNADRVGLRLLDAFKDAGVSDSTFYRARQRNGDIRLAVAKKVEEKIFGLSTK